MCQTQLGWSHRVGRAFPLCPGMAQPSHLAEFMRAERFGSKPPLLLQIWVGKITFHGLLSFPYSF